VSRVLPGMQAAFVDIGLERTAFLHAADIAFMRSPTKPWWRCRHRRHPPAREPGRRDPRAGDQGPDRHEGRAAHDLRALPSRYLVYMPAATAWRLDSHRGRGGAHAPEDRDHREHALAGCRRLHRAHGRAGVPAEGLAEDMAYLDKLWHHVRETSLRRKPGEIVHEDLPLACACCATSSRAA
jgi:ribonuclease G